MFKPRKYIPSISRPTCKPRLATGHAGPSCRQTTSHDLSHLLLPGTRSLPISRQHPCLVTWHLARSYQQTTSTVANSNKEYFFSWTRNYVLHQKGWIVLSQDNTPCLATGQEESPFHWIQAVSTVQEESCLPQTASCFFCSWTGVISSSPEQKQSLATRQESSSCHKKASPVLAQAVFSPYS